MSKFARSSGHAGKSLHRDDIFDIQRDLLRHEASRPDECRRPDPLPLTVYFMEAAKAADFDRALEIEREVSANA